MRNSFMQFTKSVIIMKGMCEEYGEIMPRSQGRRRYDDIFQILGGVPIMSVVCVELSTEAFRHGIISPDDVMCF